MGQSTMDQWGDACHPQAFFPAELRIMWNFFRHVRRMPLQVKCNMDKMETSPSNTSDNYPGTGGVSRRWLADYLHRWGERPDRRGPESRPDR